MNLLIAAIRAWQVFQFMRATPKDAVMYFVESGEFGVPRTTVIIGKGREAWRVTDVMINYSATRDVRPSLTSAK